MSREAESAAHRRRDAAAGRPPQGRVPGHPGPRAAQPAGADALRPGDPASGRRRPGQGDPRPAGARTAGDAHGPHRRRPARRLAHHAGQGRAAQGAAGPDHAGFRARWSCAGRPIAAANHIADDLAARRTGHPERRSGAADAGDRQPVEQRREVHPAWRPHLAHRRDRRRPRPGAASTADPRPRHRASGSPPENAARQCSTCSCRAIARSSARAPASAWD